MPRLTRWFIKTGLLYLMLSLVTGVLVAAGTATRLRYPFASLAPLYFQILMLGWITQLIFGIANWMFPIFSRETPRGSATLGWLAYAALNLGLVLQVILSFLEVVGAHSWDWAMGIAASLHFVAAVAFVLNTWNRVKGH